jgi:hypothetical protein
MLYIFNPREISYRKMFESNLYDQKFRSYESICLYLYAMHVVICIKIFGILSTKLWIIFIILNQYTSFKHI